MILYYSIAPASSAERRRARPEAAGRPGARRRLLRTLSQVKKHICPVEVGFTTRTYSNKSI